jgi:hypothetical protein
MDIAVLMRRVRNKGFLLAEVATGIALLAVVLAGLAVSLRAFSHLNDYNWARQRCTAAAQAQLDCITATGKPIEPDEMKRLWSNVDVSLDRTPGEEQWAGLELVRVTAVAQAGPQRVTVRLARYVRPRLAVATGD